MCLRLHFFWNNLIAKHVIKYGIINVDNKIIFDPKFLIKNNVIIKIFLPSHYWKNYMKPFAILKLHTKLFQRISQNIELSLSVIAGIFLNLQFIEYDLRLNFKKKFSFWNNSKLFGFLLNNIR